MNKSKGKGEDTVVIARLPLQEIDVRVASAPRNEHSRRRTDAAGFKLKRTRLAGSCASRLG